jgi:NAD(P)-dependent dehydrogenase (short-subunit alcohol dehydrogenase family)
LAQSLAEEIGPRGIRVNSVAPGYIGEGIIDLVAKMRAPQHGKSVEEMKESLLATLMLRRAAEPEEIADAIVFFLSDRSRAITGQCLDVNAGEHAN